MPRNGHTLTEAAVGKIDAEAARRKRGERQRDENSTRGPTVAQTLIAIGTRCELFHDERDAGYAVVTDNGINRVLRLRGREFRRWLAGRYYKETRGAANGEAIAAALNVLEAQAAFEGARVTLHNRFAELDDTVYIDLCDERWRVVRVTADGWEVLDRPPILFRRYAHQQALPEPERGGDLNDLRKFLNVRSEQDCHAVEAWLVSAPFSNAPRPALDFHGPQGAAKSTAARVLKSLTDPSATDSVDLGRDPGALAQVLDHHAVPYFDNLTSIPTWASDMLCKAVTGGGFSKRELYTDSEDIILAFKRVPILTGINIAAHNPDLLDRMLLIELDRVAPEKRRDEREFWAAFNKLRPRLFGALLDAIVGTLRWRDRVQLKERPRMADFTALACAYAEHIGLGAAKMLNILTENAGRQTQEVIESDALATAVRDLLERQGRYVGTATELLAVLNAPYSHPKAVPEGWPKSAKALGKRLRVLQTTLADIGITIACTKAADGKSRQIELAVQGDIQTSETSEMSEPGSGASAGQTSASDKMSAVVRQTSVRKANADAASDVTDISDVRLPTATPHSTTRDF